MVPDDDVSAVGDDSAEWVDLPPLDDLTPRRAATDTASAGSSRTVLPSGRIVYQQRIDARLLEIMIEAPDDDGTCRLARIGLKPPGGISPDPLRTYLVLLQPGAGMLTGSVVIEAGNGDQLQLRDDRLWTVEDLRSEATALIERSVRAATTSADRDGWRRVARTLGAIDIETAIAAGAA